MRPQVAYSILTSDFYHLGDELDELAKEGIDIFHLDVMDGHFVPNISFGPRVIESIRKHTKIPLDCHLMIAEPFAYLDRFIATGVDMISFHYESTDKHQEIIHKIKNNGLKVGMAISPKTPVEAIVPYLKDLDYVLQMTVEPGFGGQSFIEETLPKIKYLEQYRKDHQLHYMIQVDGGINEKTAQLCVENGVDILVAGSYLYSAKNRRKSLQNLYDLK